MGAVNIKEIREMINLMNENGLVELEIEKEGMRIRLKKTGSTIESTHAPIVFEQHKSAAATPAQAQAAQKAAEAVLSVKTIEIKAPMVGTFYRSPAPDAAPYVEVGQTIDAGQVICIIEAMFGEMRVLREEPVTGMNSVDIGYFCCADYSGDIEITC
jgi:acetyl-CoA carboxylase biotin carboxyl carrier protein